MRESIFILRRRKHESTVGGSKNSRTSLDFLLRAKLPEPGAGSNLPLLPGDALPTSVCVFSSMCVVSPQNGVFAETLRKTASLVARVVSVLLKGRKKFHGSLWPTWSCASHQPVSRPCGQRPRPDIDTWCLRGASVGQPRSLSSLGCHVVRPVSRRISCMLGICRREVLALTVRPFPSVAGYSR